MHVHLSVCYHLISMIARLCYIKKKKTYQQKAAAENARKNKRIVLKLFSFSLAVSYCFVSGSFQTKRMYSGPNVSCVNWMKRQSVVCPKHAFLPCWMAVQYVARVHFSASSFYFFLYVYMYMHVLYTVYWI